MPQIRKMKFTLLAILLSAQTCYSLDCFVSTGSVEKKACAKEDDICTIMDPKGSGGKPDYGCGKAKDIPAELGLSVEKCVDKVSFTAGGSKIELDYACACNTDGCNETKKLAMSNSSRMVG